MKKKLPVAIKVDQTKFENISYEQWKDLVPNVLNYDLLLKNIEELDLALKRRKQLEVYLACNGKIPAKYVESVNQLKKTALEIKNLKQQLAIHELDLNFDNKIQDEIDKLEKEVNFEFVHNGKIDETNPAYFYFKNPYFIKGNQHFKERSPALKSELKDLNRLIKKQLKPSFKPSLRMIDLITVDIKRILHIKEKNATIRPLIDFVRHYIDEIINTEDYYYQELLARSL